MRPLFGFALEKYLMQEIRGVSLRKPPKRENGRGPARDREYLAWIRTLPCCACGAPPPSEAAHSGNDGGMSLKASDHSAIPLCAACHRTGQCAYHRGVRTFERHFSLSCARVVRGLRREWERMTA